MNCGESHQSFSRDCRHFLREKEIIYIKINSNVSFSKARSLYRQNNGDNYQTQTMSSILKGKSQNNNKFFESKPNLKAKLLNFTANITQYSDLNAAVKEISDILKEIYNKEAGVTSNQSHHNV